MKRILEGKTGRKRKHLDPFDWFVMIAMTILALIIVIPVYLCLVTAFVTEGSYINNPVQFFPKELTLANFQYIIEKYDLWTCYKNSIINTALSVAYGMICTVSMGYAFSFRNWPGRKLAFCMLVFTMFFGGGLLPDYMLAKNLHLINTRWGAILWGGVGVTNVIITRNNIENLPCELKDAAYIDGAGEVTVFFKIILPLLKPTLATFALFFAVAAWNDYFWPMLMLQSNDLRTLPLMLRTLVISDTFDTSAFNASIADELGAFTEGIKMAGVLLTMLPVMCIYPFLQKHFAKGMLLGSIKD